ncbi:MAG: hypothetical protein HQK79_03945 [Desulfobacterales bacterium]|nr:hypothetical protein [Desulfobacterales bacterium]MBF0397367.1 hypothetical protein [Desulfobacterales bacterium]
MAKANEKDLLASKIFLHAVLPVIKVMLEDDTFIHNIFRNVSARVQFSADNDCEKIGAHLVFDYGDFQVVQGLCENPDLSFSFNSVSKMNAFFGGKLVLPKISGITNLFLFIKVLYLLMGLKILMPDSRPTDPIKKRLKVKMTFYMITTALSQYNKGADPEMVKWTKKQPERIYQISVDEDIAAYLKVKAGKTKSGRGLYTKRRPFVHMKFNGVDGAFPVIMNDVDMVAAVSKGYLVVEGSPEYGAALGNFMVRIQNLIT